MQTYTVTGVLVLSFIIDGEQQDILITSGTVLSNGTTIWFIEPGGSTYESITTPNVIDIALGLGVLKACS